MTEPAPNMHATMLIIENKGVLLTGPSGAGKSDLALRVLATNFSGFFCAEPPQLVSDDQVLLRVAQGKLYGKAPEPLKGLLEVRHVGICSFPYVVEAQIHGVVELTSDHKPERVPPSPLEMTEIQAISLPKVQLNPFEQSAPHKLVLMVQNFSK